VGAGGTLFCGGSSFLPALSATLLVHPSAARPEFALLGPATFSVAQSLSPPLRSCLGRQLRSFGSLSAKVSGLVRSQEFAEVLAMFTKYLMKYL
jgi:hypothetical protein